MPDQPQEGEGRGLPESLRTAIERTFAATADSAVETRDRAQELLDEVSRRGRASAGAASKVIEAIEGMRLATREDMRALELQLKELSERVARLESQAKVEG